MKSLTYSNGTWGTVEDQITSNVEQALTRLGFSQRKELACIVGSVEIYTRDSSSPSFAFNFLCKLYVGSRYSGGYYRVWIEGIIDLIKFLKEINAHEEPDYGEIARPLVTYLTGDTYFESALEELHDYFRRRNKEKQEGS